MHAAIHTTPMDRMLGPGSVWRQGKHELFAEDQERVLRDGLPAM